ncbi:MAG TPA: GNAT family N-acetyltransferase [Gaiellaceae bacterium]|jgi:ribosomal protein S18 acetylase RimI-like enzyme
MLAIEPASPADAPALATVFVRCWRDGYRGVVADQILDALAVDDAERRWHTLVAEHRVLVARDGDGSAVGMVRFGADEDDPRLGHVFSLYVDPAASGAGVGRALLVHACAELASSGFSRATLWVFEANERALRFYRANGWAPTGRTRVEPEWLAPELQLATELA